MRRSHCPSVIKAREELILTPEKNPKDNGTVENHEAFRPESAILGVGRPVRKRSIDVSLAPPVSDHLSVIADLEAQNADKIAELKSLLRMTSESPSSIPASTDSWAEKLHHVDGERIGEELASLRRLRAQIDAKLATRSPERKVGKRQTRRNERDDYEMIMETSRNFFARIAEMEQVTVKEIYGRFNVEEDE